MMRLAQRAARSGIWRVSLRRGDGSVLPPSTDFKLPGGQSGVVPSDPMKPGHVRLERTHDGLVLELHAGLQWLGRSGATHEFDVSVVPHDIAEDLRTHGGGHPRGLPVAAFECKDRDGIGSTDEMRQKVSRLFDVVLVTRPAPGASYRIFQTAFGPSGWGRRSSQYRAFFKNGAFGVVRVGGFSKGARRLGAHYHVGLHQHIYTRSQTILDIEGQWMDLLGDIDNLI